MFWRCISQSNILSSIYVKCGVCFRAQLLAGSYIVYVLSDTRKRWGREKEFQGPKLKLENKNKSCT